MQWASCPSEVLGGRARAMLAVPACPYKPVCLPPGEDNKYHGIRVSDTVSLVFHCFRAESYLLVGKHPVPIPLADHLLDCLALETLPSVTVHDNKHRKAKWKREREREK